ncbi:MAG: hypothetical protein PHP00_06710 [Thiotrichaceae bacterium]|nr:hypothetical protein [Thiotrichaceae bacterium]
MTDTNYMQWIQLGMTALLTLIIPFAKYAHDNLKNMIDERMLRIVERIEQQEKRNSATEQGLNEIRLLLAKDYIERREFNTMRDDMMKEFRAIEQQLKTLNSDLTAQWKEFFANREKVKEIK